MFSTHLLTVIALTTLSKAQVTDLRHERVFKIGENTARWHATEIYQRMKNDWKLIHSHWTESKIK
jgi:hypothetical protein